MFIKRSALQACDMLYGREKEVFRRVRGDELWREDIGWLDSLLVCITALE